jgi:cytochrome c oxidase subunit 3
MSAVPGGHGHYFVPEPSPYPILLAAALFLLGLGAAFLVNSIALGWAPLAGGGGLVIYVLYRWFSRVIGETRAGAYGLQEDRAFRWGMMWFITSEVVFFASLFGVLFYERNIAIPWLASFSDAHSPLSTYAPWPAFHAAWPSGGPAGKPFGTVSPWGIPALNTLILLSSGATITWAHAGLRAGNRARLGWGLALTIFLGATFLAFQVREFAHAYTELGLTLSSGVYGATFFILTGFHGLHVTVGTIMLSAVLARALKGDFTPQDHFGFEAASWYWHFVDVVWLLLFVFVYWL